MSENKTKICRVCGEDKPVIEFHSKGKGYYDYQCKVCKWFSKRNIDYSGKNWTYDEDRFIIDNLLSSKLNVNEIASKLNKTIKEVCIRIIEDLKISGSTKIPLIVKCTYCHKEIKVAPHEIVKYDNNFCSVRCHGDYQLQYPYRTETIIDKICPQCENPFQVTKHKKKQMYCSRECSSLAKEDKVVIKCKICDADIGVKRSMANKTATCSKDCAVENRRRICEKKSIKYTVSKICEWCGSEYSIVSSQEESSRFCTKQCHNNWMSENLVGENHPGFTSELLKCDYCGKEHYQKQYRLNNGQRHFFCSNQCRQDWYAKVYSQTEEYRKLQSMKAVRMLSEGRFGHTDTEPQQALDRLLYEMGIDYTNEYNCKYYSVDNHLTNHNLMIECMGTFWHADNRAYSKINSDIQVKRIRKDKAKKTYVQNKYDVNILYIWEYDILNNTDMCIDLILNYINNNGELMNYHSFNYFHHEGELLLDTNLIIPYMEYSPEDLNDIIDLSVKESMRKRDESKWIEFYCDYCGDKKEQLISKYNLRKNHFCSVECVHKFESQNNNVEVTCDECGDTLTVENSKLKRQKSFFCSKDCYTKNANKGAKNVVCNYCKSEFLISQSRHKRSVTKVFHCSQGCRDNYHKTKVS